MGAKKKDRSRKSEFTSDIWKRIKKSCPYMAIWILQAQDKADYLLYLPTEESWIQSWIGFKRCVCVWGSVRSGGWRYIEYTHTHTHTPMAHYQASRRFLDPPAWGRWQRRGGALPWINLHTLIHLYTWRYGYMLSPPAGQPTYIHTHFTLPTHTSTSSDPRVLFCFWLFFRISTIQGAPPQKIIPPPAKLQGGRHVFIWLYL
ncbi:hypothetical protein DFH27DRAFT_156876 [Peziza echinospora]|nr:hypothetical protein DFH27DRAFT_156876 [Peziza echinospora]